MRVTLRYFDGCPHWEIAYERVIAALREAGLSEVTVDREQVSTQEQAQRLGFAGSPTILVDGRDPFAGEGSPAGLGCRVFVTPEGPQGAPTLGQLREEFRRAGRAG